MSLEGLFIGCFFMVILFVAVMYAIFDTYRSLREREKRLQIIEKKLDKIAEMIIALKNR